MVESAMDLDGLWPSPWRGWRRERTAAAVRQCPLTTSPGLLGLRLSVCVVSGSQSVPAVKDDKISHVCPSLGQHVSTSG